MQQEMKIWYSFGLREPKYGTKIIKIIHYTYYMSLMFRIAKRGLSPPFTKKGPAGMQGITGESEDE